MSLWQLTVQQLLVAAEYRRELSNEELMANEIFKAILDGKRTIKSIMAVTRYSSSTVSKYLKIIEGRGSIKVIRNIRNGPCRIELLRDY